MRADFPSFERFPLRTVLPDLHRNGNLRYGLDAVCDYPTRGTDSTWTVRLIVDLGVTRRVEPRPGSRFLTREAAERHIADLAAPYLVTEMAA